MVCPHRSDTVISDIMILTLITLQHLPQTTHAPLGSIPSTHEYTGQRRILTDVIKSLICRLTRQLYDTNPENAVGRGSHKAINLYPSGVKCLLFLTSKSNGTITPIHNSGVREKARCNELHFSNTASGLKLIGKK
jgi:hypothetical protein